MVVRLSRGIIESHLMKGVLPPNDNAVFRVIGTRFIQKDDDNSLPRKYRLAISDLTEEEANNLEKEEVKKHRFTFVLAVINDERSDVPSEGSIVNFAYDTNASPETWNLMKDGEKFPLWIVNTFTRMDDDSGVQPGPETPKTSNGIQQEQKPPVKRKIEPETTTPKPGPSTANRETLRASTSPSSVKRALFSSTSLSRKETHKIKDLNPYQNKYTILARVTCLEPLTERSSSRFQGHVFNVTLQDDTGDIRATAFKEEALKFHPMLKEGKAYYVSNAHIKPIQNPRFNTTSHRFELTLGPCTVISESKLDDKLLPKVQYNLVKLSDVYQMDVGERVNVIGICIGSDELREITTRNGKQVFKKDVNLVDESVDAPMRVTIWAEKAQEFDGVNKVVLVKSASITEYQGKNLSVTIGSSFEVNPDLDRTKELMQWYQTYSTVNVSSQAQSSKERKSGDYVALADVKSECSKFGGDKPRFYTVDAYLVVLKDEHNITYRSCPIQNCHKKLTELANGGLECSKCKLPTKEYSRCFNLRGMIADATDFLYVTAFDEAGRELFGISADVMEEMMQSSRQEADKKIRSIKFHRYTFCVSVKLETFNEESRLKAIILSATKIDPGSQEHIRRMKTQIEQLKREIS